MKKKRGYWLQTLYAIICPDGTAEDYYYTKKEAIKNLKALNKED